MINQFVLLLCVFVILFLIINQYYYHMSNITSFLFKGQSYLVKSSTENQMKNSAEILSGIIEKVKALMIHLSEGEHSKDPAVERLLKVFGPNEFDKMNNKIIENTASCVDSSTSYSLNKGEKIVVCIRDCKGEKKPIHQNTIMFVVIHELAHVMTKSIGHEKEFWDNMRFLLCQSGENHAKIYTYTDYGSEVTEYCGMNITSNPLKCKDGKCDVECNIKPSE